MTKAAFRLYFICHHVEALVASQLPPTEFGVYLATGLRRQNDSEDIFAEIDPEALMGSGFDLERARRETKAHADGAPKRSRYISVYRVLEHLPLESFKHLYLTTRDGRVLELPQSGDFLKRGTGEHLYLELCPTTPMVVSRLHAAEFAKHVTDLSNPVSLPRVMFADLKLNLTGNQLDPTLPYPHPEHIIDCLNELKSKDKKMKVVSRHPRVPGFYRTIDRGFYVGEGDNLLFYPFPTLEELETLHHVWWRSATLG